MCWVNEIPISDVTWGKCHFSPWIALRNCLIMIFGMTSASALGNIPWMHAGCIVNISQAFQFTQEYELGVCISSDVSSLLDTLFYIGSKGWRAGVLGFGEQLDPSTLCLLQAAEKLLMESRENYSCWDLWSQGHVLHLQGHHGIIQGVACTHSAAEREFFFFLPHPTHGLPEEGHEISGTDELAWCFEATALLNQWLPPDSS